MEHLFQARYEASIAAAGHIATALRHRLGAEDQASIVVSGGSSPIKCFAELAKADLDWYRTRIVLSDERWVAAEHEDSNEKLVRTHLLVDKASEATLLPSYQQGLTLERGCAALESSLRGMPSPFASVLLGMGTDGHFASLFPDAKNLKRGLRIDSDELCMGVETAASPHPRLSLTLSALTRSDHIVLLIFGDEKLEVYEQAKNASAEWPVAHLLRQQRTPVDVYWAP